jgi:uncharacterized protein (TIGR02268 family)
MTVSFADGLAPPQVVIALVPGTVAVDTRVRVSRKPATMGELLAELEKARAQLEATGQEPQGLSAPCPPLTLTEVLYSGVLGQSEFSARPVWELPDNHPGAENIQLTRYLTSDRLLLAFRFLNTDSAAEPWTPDQVRLIHLATHTLVKVLSIEMRPARFVPDGAAFVVVELEAVAFQQGDKFSLQFSNKAGTQALFWDEVSL